MSRILRIVAYLLAVVILAVLLLNRLDPTGGEPTATTLLPELPAYRQVEGTTITAYLGALGEGAALLAGQPQLAAAVGAVDHIAACYQDVGAVALRAYSQAERPLSAGVVVIANEGELTDPANLLSCAAIELPALSSPDGIEIALCSAVYRMNKDGIEYFVGYAASTADVCQDFCTNLDGCSAHKPV